MFCVACCFYCFLFPFLFPFLCVFICGSSRFILFAVFFLLFFRYVIHGLVASSRSISFLVFSSSVTVFFGVVFLFWGSYCFAVPFRFFVGSVFFLCAYRCR